MRARALYDSGLSITLRDQSRWLIDSDLLFFNEETSSKKPIGAVYKEGADFRFFKIEEGAPLFINEKKVEDSVILRDGDTVTLGPLSFQFSLEKELLEEKEESIDKDPYVLQPSQMEMGPRNPTQNMEEEEEKAIAEKETLLEDPLEEEAPISEEKLAEIHFDLTLSGRFLLKVIGGPNTGAEFALEAPETGTKGYLLGTDPSSCDIVFHDTSVSRQHARLFISIEGEIEIEDLKSRNGTLVDGKSQEEKTALTPASVVTLGTTSFVIYDREGNMQTIISPLLPDIVKVLQKEDKEESHKTGPKTVENLPPPPPPVKKEKPIGAFIIATFITGFFVLSALGISALFNDAPVIETNTIPNEGQLKEALSPFPSVKYSFNKTTGQLLLVGNVLTGTEKNQLLYNLQGMKFIKNIDFNGVTIDELVWKNVNEVLARNPAWRSVSIQSSSPGHFILQGYLKTRKAADGLYDYIITNFPFLNKIEKKVIVDEEIVQTITSLLQGIDIRSVDVKFSEGEVTLSGAVAQSKTEPFKAAVQEIKQIPGVRLIRNVTTAATQELSTVNISDRYEVSGYSKIGAKTSVVINGRIVTLDDSIDGMAIRKIEPSYILLEKEGVNYRIDYTR